MPPPVHLKAGSGTVEVELEEVLATLANWLVRRNCSALTPGTSVATSRVLHVHALSHHPITVTLEVHVSSDTERLVPAPLSEPSQEGPTT